MATNKSFKISQLPAIQNIDNKDLLLVSDYDGGKCISKKMSMLQISNFIKNALAPYINQIVEETVAAVLDEHIDEAVRAAVTELVDPIVEEKVDAAISAYDFKPKVTEVLDELDGVEDNVYHIEGGNASGN